MIADPNAMPESLFKKGDVVMFDTLFMERVYTERDKEIYEKKFIKMTVIGISEMMQQYIYRLQDEEGHTYNSLSGMGMIRIKDYRNGRLNELLK